MPCDSVMLKINNISFSYNCKKAVNGVTIQANKGEFIGLMGPNGSGKTTLMRCINRVLHAQEGSILVDDVDLKTLKIMEIARICANIPADVPDDFNLTVRQFVSLGRYPFRTTVWWEKDEDEEIVQHAMDLFNVTKFHDRKLNELSSGEKARVLLAKGLVQEPKTLLVDEPSAHLDLKYKMQVMQSLFDLSRTGVTIITASHDINLLSKYCDKIVLLSGGSIVSFGSPKDVIREDMIRDVYGVNVTLIENGAEVFVIPLNPVDEKNLDG
jgi:iron complex transport system ATP-binding protein